MSRVLSCPTCGTPEREETLDEGQWEVLCDMALELGLPPVVYQIVRQAELARAEVGRLALKLDCANAQADLFAERLREVEATVQHKVEELRRETRLFFDERKRAEAAEARCRELEETWSDHKAVCGS